MRVLKDQLHKKSPNLSYSDELLLRFNYASGFNLQQVADHVRGYDEWHYNEMINQPSRAGQAILEHGHIYSYGRDK